VITEVAVPLLSADGTLHGELRISCVDRKESWNTIPSIVDMRNQPPGWDAGNVQTSAEAPVQLLEEMTYGYEIDSPGAEVREVHPVELRSFTKSPSTGRLEVRRATGTVSIRVELSNGKAASCELEVRSRKLSYRSDYRAMLRRISEEAAELVQLAFAPSSITSLQPDTFKDPATLYQRFAFMQSLVTSPDVVDALQLIERRPHHEHIESTAEVDPSKAVRSSPRLARELVASGPRQRIARPIGGIRMVPTRLSERTHLPTFDTAPNQFVKYVLTRWRDLAQEVASLMGASSAAEARGRREALATAELLERALQSPAMKEAGRLRSFPQSNQVLQGRSGYREILESFLLAEAAAIVDWGDHGRQFSAGQRDVADLYEHWVFLELVRIVEGLMDFTVDKRDLISKSKNGLTLGFRRSGRAVVVATGTRRGVPVRVEIWFNKSFGHSASNTPATSWTESLRPDCSMRIAPASEAMDADTWIHFDAKYRVQNADQVMKSERTPDPAEDGGSLTGGRPMANDLTKMHAYRDAIRQTAGAYVLYPGSDDADRIDHRAYHEVLPGLGAFVLRPTASGHAATASAAILGSFISEVIDHVAAQGTAAQRSRYWGDRSYRQRPAVALDHERALMKPAQDTTVLLGFVRGDQHLEWCEKSGLYNLRADADRDGSLDLSSPELAADIVILYAAEGEAVAAFETSGAVFIRSARDLSLTGYPNPRGLQYICLEIRPISLTAKLDASLVRSLARSINVGSPVGAPVTTTWDRMFLSAVR
jgi:predicted component of viral defense system (DUF524 family)